MTKLSLVLLLGPNHPEYDPNIAYEHNGHSLNQVQILEATFSTLYIERSKSEVRGNTDGHM